MKRLSRQRDPDAVRQFIERFAATLVDAGMPRMPALVFITLLADDEGRLTADELVERLQISRAAVSGAIRYLTHVGVVRRERPAGSRRDQYVLADGDWFELVARRERILEQWVATTRVGVDALGADSPAGQRLAESAEFFEFMQAELGALLDRWRRRRSTRRHR